MATTKISKKEMQQDEFIESVFDLGEWLEKNWQRVAIVAGVVVGAILLGFAWMSMRGSANAAANDVLAQGIAAFDPQATGADAPPPPNYPTALALFEQAADKAGGQTIGAVARLYRARTLIAMGRSAEAVPILEAIASAGDARLAAQAKVSLAEAAATGGDPERAAKLLQEIASATDGAYPPDGALMLLAGVREQQGKNGDAKRAYEDLIARFPQSPFASEARQQTGDASGPRQAFSSSGR